MSHCFQFVDSIDPAVATILLDLDNGLPFNVSDASAPPPPLRRASSSSMLSDGTLTSGSAYDDRTVPLTLRVEDVAAEIQAAAVQKLARILNSSQGAWLKWHGEGMAHPVYFRTRRCSFDVLDEWQSDVPRRSLPLDIPADPFAYGEKVTGTFNVANDTFVKSWTDPIQGDVATPLALTFPQALTLKDYVIIASSIARSDGLAQSTPYIKPLSGTGTAVPVSGWTVTDSSDSSTIGGTKRRLARAAAGVGSTQIGTPTLLAWPGLPPGEYKVMVRARLVAGTDAVLSFIGGPAGVPGHNVPLLTLPIRNAPSSGAGWDWYDMGVVALPAGTPRPDNVFKTATPAIDPYWTLSVYAAAITTLDLDSVLLIPVGGAAVISARTSLSQAPATTAAKTVYLDGVTDRWFFNQNGLLGYFDAVAGDLPVLVPGATNTLHMLVSAAVNAAGTYRGYADVKTVTTTVTYAYFPRYLGGFRPAAT